MADPSTTTEIQAVNTILSAVGELPTTATVLANGTSADVVMAKQILDEVNREVQAEGWHFNTDYKVTLPLSTATAAQGLIQCESDVDSGDFIDITGTNGVVRRFTFTTAPSTATGDTSDWDGITAGGTYVSLLDSSDVRLTTGALIAAQLVVAINHSVSANINVTAVQAVDPSNIYDSTGLNLAEFPTNHPDYDVNGASLVKSDTHATIVKNVLLTQDTVGAAGNTIMINGERQSSDYHTPPDQLSTYNFGENGMRVGKDAGIIADNIVRATVEGRDLTLRYDSVTQNRRLYDKEENTYIDASTIEEKVTTVSLFEFYGIPEAAKRYITIRSARLFQDRMVGSVSHHQFTERDEFKALLDLKEYEGSTASPTIFDNLGTYNIIKRGSVL